MKNRSEESEGERMQALQSYDILDSAPERAFDDFTEIASYICQTPVALITFVDKDRQWFKSQNGLRVNQTPREQAFCDHTILGDRVMVVEDARCDSRFYTNPLVTHDPHIRFYAGAPLITHEGFALGSLCVIDSKPGTLDPKNERVLEALARQVVAQLELRRTSRLLAESLGRVKVLQGLLPICPHCKSIRNDQGYWTRLESYLLTMSEANLTHCICDDCMAHHYPEVYAELQIEEGV